jgi:DNA-binding transcriptional LysR family regulator
MVMELIEIEAFAIAAEGSFTRAAAVLHLSQPAISRRIDLLERDLGTPLFARVPTGARLTDAGEAFLPHAHRALAALRDGAAAVDALLVGDRGTITLASTRLTGRLVAFRATHPEVRLDLRTARSDEVGSLVRRGEVALGLRYFPDPSEAVVSTPVSEEGLVVVCGGSSPLAELETRSIVSPAALAGQPWVSFPPDAGSSGEPFARVLGRRLATAGLSDSERVAVDSLTAQKRLIEAGFGLGLLPASAVDEELRLGSLRRLPVPAVETTVPVVLLTRRDSYLSSATSRLIAILTEA